MEETVGFEGRVASVKVLNQTGLELSVTGGLAGEGPFSPADPDPLAPGGRATIMVELDAAALTKDDRFIVIVAPTPALPDGWSTSVPFRTPGVSVTAFFRTHPLLISLLVVGLLIILIIFVPSLRRWARGERPHCLTIRELLILVVTVENDELPKHLEEVFRWFFERTRSMVVALGSGAIVAVGIAVTNADGESGITPIAIGVAICLFLAAVWTNSVVAPLHREHLECLALLQKIKNFEPELRAYLAAEGWPESKAMLPWRWRTGWWTSKAVRRKLEEISGKFGTTVLESELDIGRYLVDTLAEVPTDLFEREVSVRKAVKRWLDRASKAKKDPEASSHGSAGETGDELVPLDHEIQ